MSKTSGSLNTIRRKDWKRSKSPIGALVHKAHGSRHTDVRTVRAKTTFLAGDPCQDPSICLTCTPGCRYISNDEPTMWVSRPIYDCITISDGIFNDLLYPILAHAMATMGFWFGFSSEIPDGSFWGYHLSDNEHFPGVGFLVTNSLCFFFDDLVWDMVPWHRKLFKSTKYELLIHLKY